MKTTFQKFLEQKCFEETNCLDDDFQKAWENWEVLQDIEQICNYAEMWKLEILIKRTEKERDEIKEKLEKLLTSNQ